ncbi:MAG TPA: hypothetical protein VFY10_11320 [Dehalococcoidia bacterium]|nr:hypothetical protein [Dehalococcoidia bacterium]
MSMDIFDRLALMGRRYETRHSPRTGGTQFSLSDVLLMFHDKAILEMTVQSEGRAATTARPDAERKLKLSLLDGMSEIHVQDGGWYEVQSMAPSGDFSKVRITAKTASGAAAGELRLLVGRRNMEHYFLEDPLLASIELGLNLERK